MVSKWAAIKSICSATAEQKAIDVLKMGTAVTSWNIENTTRYILESRMTFYKLLNIFLPGPTPLENLSITGATSKTDGTAGMFNVLFPQQRQKVSTPPRLDFCCLQCGPFSMVFLSCPGNPHEKTQLVSTWVPLCTSNRPNFHSCYLMMNTSSTAQGGGGSFKNRKPIGEIGCCESPMAEQKHWWIELSNCVTD